MPFHNLDIAASKLTSPRNQNSPRNSHPRAWGFRQVPGRKKAGSSYSAGAQGTALSYYMLLRKLPEGEHFVRSSCLGRGGRGRVGLTVGRKPNRRITWPGPVIP